MSPSLKRIRWRLVWTSLLALSIALGTFYLSQWVYTYSDDQCFWKIEKDKVLIMEILPEGVAEVAGLLEGDELLAINGKKVTPRTLDQAQRFINELDESRVVLYTLRRFDRGEEKWRTIHLPVGVVKPFNFTALIVLLTGLVAWAIGLVVVVSTPQRKIARHFYYLGVLALLTPLGIQGNAPQYILAPLQAGQILVISLVPPLVIHFFLRFPHPFALRTNRRFLFVLYGTFLALGLLGSLASLLGALAPIWPAIRKVRLGPLLNLANILIPLGILTSLALFWWGAFKLSAKRRRGLMVALVFSTGILIDILIYSWLSARAQGQSLMFQRQSWAFFLPLPLLPLSFGFAIFRHGFFDVRRALVRWASYFAVLGLTLAGYLAGLAWIFNQSMQVIPAAWVGVLVGVSALPIGWVLRWLMMTLRRRFRRDLHTARELILGNLRETKKRFSEEALLRSLADSLREAFRPQLLLVLPVSQRQVTLPPVPDLEIDDPGAEFLGQPRTLVLPPGLIRLARENHELVLGLGSDEADWARDQGPELRAHLDALEAQVLVIILANGEPCVAVLLGGKYAELNYGREDRELLREVAMAAGVLFETALMHQRMLDQGRLEQELQTARKIQESLITIEAPFIPGFQLALRMDPALETGGDLLWVKRRQNQGRWLAAVGDVSGKGLAAALYMSQATALLKFASQQGDMDLERLLPALDQTMRNLMSTKDFLTLSVVEWDEEGRFRVARAGHPAPLLVKGNRPGEVCELACGGRGLGLRPKGPSNWEIQEGHLQPREWLVMYSDGLTEAMNKRSELYGLDRLSGQLQHFWGTGSVRAACEAVYRDVTAFETQNRDDRTLFILAREGA